MLRLAALLSTVLVLLSVSEPALAVAVRSPSIPFVIAPLGRSYDSSLFSSAPTVVSFDNATLGCSGSVAGLSGDYSLQNSGSAFASPPGVDSTCFLVAPGINSPSSTGSATLRLAPYGLGPGERIDTLGFYWGSIGSNDIVEFLDTDGNAIALNGYGFGVTGTDLMGMIDALGPAGNQPSDPSNRYVYFNFDPAEVFTSIRFTSIGRAFELDTVAFSIVPSNDIGEVSEPTMLSLLGLGLLAIGTARRHTISKIG